MFHLCLRLRSSRVGLHPWLSSGSPSSVNQLTPKTTQIGDDFDCQCTAILGIRDGLLLSLSQYHVNIYIYMCVYDIHTLYTYTYIYMQNSSLSLYVLNKPACMGLTARRVMELHWGFLMAPTWLVCYTPHWEQHGATSNPLGHDWGFLAMFAS